MIKNHTTLFITIQKYNNTKHYTNKIYYHLHNKITNNFNYKHKITQIKKILNISNYIINTLNKFLHKHNKNKLKSKQKTI